MLPDFERAVEAFAQATVRERSAPRSDERDPSTSVGRFLLDVHARMPDYLRLPFRLLTLAFDAWSLPRHGKPFHRLPHELRIKHVQAWKTSRLEPRRRLIEFYETLAVFSLYSDLYGQDYGYASEQRDLDAGGGAGGTARA
ncbi:hypothetical protein [Falsiroseomonas sp.]|uniref:hypothetical protein n=1 Tax=Falsiroseomonas sp. TaxID=2870721 RepID=UPI0035645979